MKSIHKYLSYQMETKCGLTDIHTTKGRKDRWMDRHMDGQRENIIPHHLCVAGYKNDMIRLAYIHCTYKSSHTCELLLTAIMHA